MGSRWRWKETEGASKLHLDGVEEVISLTTINQIEGNDGFMEVNKLINNKLVDLNHIKKIKVFL